MCPSAGLCKRIISSYIVRYRRDGIKHCATLAGRFYRKSPSSTHQYDDLEPDRLDGGQNKIFQLKLAGRGRFGRLDAADFDRRRDLGDLKKKKAALKTSKTEKQLLLLLLLRTAFEQFHSRKCCATNRIGSANWCPRLCGNRSSSVSHGVE